MELELKISEYLQKLQYPGTIPEYIESDKITHDYCYRKKEHIQEFKLATDLLLKALQGRGKYVGFDFESLHLTCIQKLEHLGIEKPNWYHFFFGHLSLAKKQFEINPYSEKRILYTLGFLEHAYKWSFIPFGKEGKEAVFFKALTE